MFIIIIIIIILLLLFFLKDYREYEKSTYKSEVNLKYSKVRFNKGYNGEYLTFKELESLPGYSKILGNVYIPKDDGTTEIDIIFIHQTGIYVIESKNYSGWIFGSEKSPNWTQTFQNGKKFSFYNPIWQNNAHIKYLKNLLDDINEEYFKSIIVFSERCTLKKLEIFSESTMVIKRNELRRNMKVYLGVSKGVLSPMQVVDIYKKLKTYANVGDEVKAKHIENIDK